ncbi:alpha-acetolactate decarboxylase [Desulfovibrio sp. X2]|uniref:acetolactate decarboxylase n=1 Tax=Desulfovibrio sp. X2 TaxID=941449 RepID=UPI000358AB1A|nr:acetolactate decarboxylase [Desulfovibrio sp. X2]EPR43521.1 alpha-acetolactate decarboxylase [Desulfovibrio sp. X2]
MKRRSCCLGLILVLLLASAGFAADSGPAFTQYSTLGALLRGGYDGTMTIGEALRHGDYGLGTVDGLDGELICVRSACRQIRADGRAYAVAPEATTPFIQIAPVADAPRTALPPANSLAEVEKTLTGMLESPNFFAVAVIEGEFASATTRSVPRQEKPYPPLAAVVKHQSVFRFGTVSGTVVAVYEPPYVGEMGVAGWHLHFLTADLAAGGHVLDLAPRKASVALATYRRLDLILPGSGAFLTQDLSPAKPGEAAKTIDAVERQQGGTQKAQ